MTPANPASDQPTSLSCNQPLTIAAMTPAGPVSDQPTADFGLAKGIELAQQAEEASPRLPLVDWLARYPHLAGKVAEYLAGSQGIQRIMPPQSESGSAIGGFELREEIGRGAMGVVYRAYDPNLKRDVAVKRVRADAMGSEGDWARFQFEAEAVASLDHENIVRVHAYGEANGTPYLVMPLMEGGSLANRLRLLGPDRCLPPKEAAELIRKIALGVHHAHQRGLLHRDLKPGNILFDVNSQPHIADFGLARRLDASHSQSASGSIAGTAAYMAPEQARGEKGLTTAADVHALGAILYELLTGEPPFGTGELIPTLKRVLEEEAVSVTKKRPDVHKDLEAICMKCLEKRPGDRYRSAGELAEDLNHFVNGEAVSARPPGFWDWIRQMTRTRPHPNYNWQTPVWHGIINLLTSLLAFGAVQADSSVVWF